MSEVCCVVFTPSIHLLLNYFCILFHTVNNSVILSNYVLFHNIFCSYFLYGLLTASCSFQPSNFTFTTSFHFRQYSFILLLICDLSYSEENLRSLLWKELFRLFLWPVLLLSLFLPWSLVCFLYVLFHWSHSSICSYRLPSPMWIFLFFSNLRIDHTTLPDSIRLMYS